MAEPTNLPSRKRLASDACPVNGIIASKTPAPQDRLTLLGLPTEVRLRILRCLLLHDGPLEACVTEETASGAPIGPPRIIIQESPSQQAQAQTQDHDSDEWTEEDSADDSDSDNTEDDESDSSGDNYDDTFRQVNLHRAILLVNRQLCKEGNIILYQENVLSVRLRAHRKDSDQSGDVLTSIFDHREHHELELTEANILHPTLLKIANVHFDIKLQHGSYSVRVRSILRFLVSWLNESYDADVPRQITIEYRDNVKYDDPFNKRGMKWFCVACEASTWDKCQCEAAVKARDDAEQETLKVLAPLKHLRKVRKVDVIGLNNKKTEILRSAILLPDIRKPKDMCRDFALLLRYLEKLPDDDDTAKAYQENHFKPLHCNKRKKKSDPFTAEMRQRDPDDHDSRRGWMTTPLALTGCPKWSREEMREAKKAMYREDAESFMSLKHEILKRANKVMTTMQANIVEKGLAVHGPWVPHDVFDDSSDDD